MVKYLIGTSGWHYEDWRGRFYPEDLPRTRWLEYYARHFSTVELNNSFYRLPTEKTFHNWHHAVPENFIFAVKASRYITHIKRLNDKESVKKFLERASHLREKLGPVLYQLPPGLHRDDPRLKSFLANLPAGQEHVIEFRHESWFADDVLRILRERHAGFCIFDMPDLRSPVAATADFAYLRFHGSGAMYSSDYSDEELKEWAEKLAELAKDLRRFYIYFNNDVQGIALKNALTLRGYLES